MRVSAELVEQMFVLGGRRLIGAEYDLLPDQLVLVIDAPDAPPGTTYMEPTFIRADDGAVTMTNPGWHS
jgi:hypothetical protein